MLLLIAESIFDENEETQLSDNATKNPNNRYIHRNGIESPFPERPCGKFVNFQPSRKGSLFQTLDPQSYGKQRSWRDLKVLNHFTSPTQL